MLEMLVFEHKADDEMVVRFILLGEKGATAFGYRLNKYGQLMGSLDLHWRGPQFGTFGGAIECDILGECYADGSYLQGTRILEDLLAHGEDAVWAELQEYYDQAA